MLPTARRARGLDGRAQPLLVLALVVVLLLGGAVVARTQGWAPSWAPAWAGGGSDQASGGNPFAERRLYADPTDLLVAADEQARSDQDSRAVQVLDRLEKVPTGIWLLPERFPTPQAVGAYVRQTVQAAGGELALLVVYGVPDRDCAAGYSGGGLASDAYLPWVQAIADAAATGHAAVVLEPDALATAVGCKIVDQRVPLMAGAVGELRDAGVPTYVDAGHSDWVPAATMAGLLRRVGVSTVRGFATNVSNYQRTDAEEAYAEQLRHDLGGTPHYVIDTSRNGAAGAGPTDWCNPAGQAFGTEPGYVDDPTHAPGLDALLWIKPPAESDGTCHDGPTAGEVWTQRAVELATAAGW